MQEEPKKWKRGDIGPDGLIFWSYHKDAKNGQQWYSDEKFKEVKARVKAYKQTPKYKEKEAARARDSYKNNPNKFRERIRQWREKHPDLAREKGRENDRRRCEMNPGLKAKEAREWREKNPEKAREMVRKSKQRQKQQAAAIQFFTLTNAAREISKALETKPKNTDEKTRDDNQ